MAFAKRTGVKMTARKKSVRKSARKSPRKKTFRKRVQRRPGHKMTTTRSSPVYNSDRAHMKMKFVEDEFSVDLPISTSINRFTYALNGIYDPYLGAGGGSVSGYALMSAQYGFSFVRGSKIEVITRRTIDTDQNSPYDVCVTPFSYSASTSLPSTIGQMREQPYTKFIAGVSIGADTAHKLTSYMSTTKIEGLSDIYAPGYRATTGNNPTNLPVWCISVANADPNILTSSVRIVISVKITYYVEWFSRYANPASFLDQVLQRAAEAGIVDEIKKKDHSTPVMPQKKDYVHKHTSECKCFEESKSDDEPDDAEYLELTDLPCRTPVKVPRDQPVIPKELPPKALVPAGPPPGRAEAPSHGSTPRGSPGGPSLDPQRSKSASRK